MFRLIIFFIFLSYVFLAGNSYSQVIINQNYTPVAGDVWLTIKMQPDSISEGDAGENLYNFFDLKILQKDTSKINYVDLLTTPVADVFPTASVASFVTLKSLNLYTYYREEENIFYSLGTANYNLNYTFSVPLSKPKLVMRYPLKYGDGFENTYNFYISTRGQQVDYFGSYKLECDGRGQIALPQGTYDCIRVKTTDSYSDRAFGSNAHSLSIINYAWYIKEFKFPVFQIKYTEQVSGEKKTTLKEVIYSINNKNTPNNSHEE